MLYPHPNDPALKRVVGGFSIFLAEGLVTVDSYGSEVVQGAFYNSEDDIAPYFGYDFVERAAREAEEAVGNKNTPAYFEAMLQRVYEDPNAEELLHMVAGVAGGFTYRMFGTSGMEYVRQPIIQPYDEA